MRTETVTTTATPIRRGDLVTCVPTPGVHFTDAETTIPRRVVRIENVRAYTDRHLPTRQQRIVTRYAALEGSTTLTPVEYLRHADAR